MVPELRPQWRLHPSCFLPCGKVEGSFLSRFVPAGRGWWCSSPAWVWKPKSGSNLVNTTVSCSWVRQRWHVILFLQGELGEMCMDCLCEAHGSWSRSYTPLLFVLGWQGDGHQRLRAAELRMMRRHV
ncbi:hypothetical protein BS78_07G053800 [Paspalum vaginatum]|nr:hypothetical protein BS78_07G053800 [Paspalum vaginatum]